MMRSRGQIGRAPHAGTTAVPRFKSLLSSLFFFYQVHGGEGGSFDERGGGREGARYGRRELLDRGRASATCVIRFPSQSELSKFVLRCACLRRTVVVCRCVSVGTCRHEIARLIHVYTARLVVHFAFFAETHRQQQQQQQRNPCREEAEVTVSVLTLPMGYAPNLTMMRFIFVFSSDVDTTMVVEQIEIDQTLKRPPSRCNTPRRFIHHLHNRNGEIIRSA